MGIPSQEQQIKGSAMGWQAPITGSNVATPGTLVKGDIDGNGKSTTTTKALAGASLVAGTYYYYVPVAGCTNCDLTFTLASGTAPTITYWPALSDGITAKGTPGTVTTLVAAAQATTSITTLKGERGIIVKIVCSVTNVFTTAEYSAI